MGGTCLLQVPRLVVHVAGPGLKCQPMFPVTLQRTGAALELFGDWPLGLACDFRNVASAVCWAGSDL